MELSLEDFKGSQILKGFTSDEFKKDVKFIDTISSTHSKLNTNFEKGLIDEELFNKAVTELDSIVCKANDFLEKSQVHKYIKKVRSEDGGGWNYIYVERPYNPEHDPRAIKEAVYEVRKKLKIGDWVDAEKEFDDQAKNLTETERKEFESIAKPLIEGAKNDLKVIELIKTVLGKDVKFDSLTKKTQNDLITQVKKHGVERFEKYLKQTPDEYRKKQNDIEKAEALIGGLGDDLTVAEIAEKQGVSVDVIKQAIKNGTEVEMEHTKDKKIAKEIATDHVTESYKYYDELEKMEEKLEQ